MSKPTDLPRPNRSCSGPATRWGARITAIGLVGSLALNAGIPESSAELFRPAPATAAHPVAKPQKPRTTKPKAAETYQERQARIGKSTRSMIAPLSGNKDQETTCVSAEFTTLSVVYDSIIESLLPSLPPQLQAAARENQRAVQSWMKNVHVSTLAVSNHPNTRGTDQDDPQYRTALSQIVVDNLLKIRDGKQNEAIPVANITLSQAVESVWLYVFAGILAPAKFGIAMLPGLGSPFNPPAPAPLNALGSFVTYNTLLTIGFTFGQLGLQYLYQGTSSAILNQCVARVTDEQKELAGKPSETVTFDIPIHPLIQGAANQLALADSDTCRPIGDLTLARIVKRTAESAKSSAPSASVRRQIDAETSKTLRQMKATMVPHNLIPADPADLTSAESIASFAGNMIPYIGGAPLDIALGLGHNIAQGDDLGQLVSLHDLTVTKSLTALHYAYYFSVYLFTTVGGRLVDPIALIPGADPGVATINPIRMIGAVLGLPLTYGLVTFHHLVRTTCFVEDDVSGTGLGAELNKQDPQAHAEAVAKAKKQKGTAAKEGTAKSRSPKTPTTSSAQRQSAPKSGTARTTRTQTSRTAP
ncbi:hypothetical protein GOHSU_58_00070 [Gordonia hirsuta DSM 44140 = NBRC 16056]|uniref:Uncharacterized protein n=1 Tax=Gordonia hirsuta DSM 44140 = NBRC 16056 TaxID=1121927 RepID=L7LDS6_9ACTN|nr:hypothetical protein [Gordonia hirsuta]GAC58906.1 hypothetical protein GOHSU_58_00070 [Gordonia hirsuta DSM 44140 = NBRC 16056]